VYYQKTGRLRYTYLTILTTHTILAVITPVLAIITLRRGLRMDVEAASRHRALDVSDLDVLSRRFAPRRGVDSPPGQELLGVITSHGPFRESYRSSRKSRGSAEAIAPPAADAVLSAERMRAALSSPAGAPALLQRALPGGGAEMVAVEGAATIPGDGGGPTETERAKPALPGAGQKPETTRARGS
jgi:hypothetical protein